MAKKLTKKQQEALNMVKELGGEVIHSTENDDVDLDPYDELVELGLLNLADEDEEENTVTYTIAEEDDDVAEDTQAVEVEEDDTPIEPDEGEDLHEVPVPETQHYGYLEYCGYKDSGFRSHLKEEAEAERERLNSTENRAATVTQLRTESKRQDRCAVYGVWAKDPGTAKGGGRRGTGLTKLYNDLKEHRGKPKVKAALENLQKVLAEVEGSSD